MINKGLDRESDRNHFSERIGRIETALGNVLEDFKEIRSSLNLIQAAQQESGKTNWSVVIAGFSLVVGLVGGLWAAAIRPLDSETRRLELNYLSVDQILRDRGIIISQQRSDFGRLEEKLGSLHTEFELVREKGSPITDKRLSLLEYKIESALNNKETIR